MSRKVRENILVTKDDQAVFPADQNVFVTSDTGGTGPTIRVAPGQLVIFNPETNISVGPTVTKSDAKELVVGVGFDETGNGVSDSIRTGFGRKLSGCNIRSVNAGSPKCGVPEVVDLLFKCNDMTKPHSIDIFVDDDVTQNQFPYNRPEKFTFTVFPNDLSCAPNCDPSQDGLEIACKLVDLINQDSYQRADITKQGSQMPRTAPKFPFHAVRLFDNSYVFCLGLTEGNCDGNCNAVAGGLKTLNYDPEGGTAWQTLTFDHNENPDGTTTTALGQLQFIVNQINDTLGDYGHATLTKGAGNCCEYQLEINTCYSIEKMTNLSDEDITPCDETNPLDPVDYTDHCVNCGDSGTGTTNYDYGIRLIAKPVEAPCNCYVPNPPKGYLARLLEINPSEGFAKGGYFKRRVQAAENPQNLGYQWQYREYESAVGGSGREHNPWNDQYGPINLPGDNDRANSTRTNCHEKYCSYAIMHDMPFRTQSVTSPNKLARGSTIVLIPSEDTTTKTEFEAILNNYITDGTCNALSSVSCS